MKRITLLLVAICIFAVTAQTRAAEATVVDKKGIKIELAKVETKELNVQIGEAWSTIPIEHISSIHLDADEKTLVLRTVTGEELKGITSSTLKGAWDLGDYSVALSAIKSVDFHRAVRSQQSPGVAEQPDGFMAICIDRAGVRFKVFGFSYNFNYSYRARVVRGMYYHFETRTNSSNPRLFLPFQYKGVVVGIPFADMSTVKFIDNPPEKGQQTWKPAVSIALKDGNTLKGKLAKLGEGHQRFTGAMVYGDFTCLVGKVAQIDFDHTRNKNAPRATLGKKGLQKDLNSGYTISVRTWQGDKATLMNGCLFNLSNGYEWASVGSTVDVKVGESKIAVELGKIKSIQFQEKSNPKAQVISTSGKTIDIELAAGSICLGGNLDKFGPAWVRMADVASFEVSGSLKK